MTKRRIIIAVIIAILVIPISAGFALNGLKNNKPVEKVKLLEVEEKNVTVGDSLSFKLNLESLLTEGYGKVNYIQFMVAAEDDGKEVKEMPTAPMMTREDINLTVNYAAGLYMISGDEVQRMLEAKKKFGFEIYPDENHEKKTRYTVYVQVIGIPEQEYPTEGPIFETEETTSDTQDEEPTLGTLKGLEEGPGEAVTQETEATQLPIPTHEPEEDILDSDLFEFTVHPLDDSDGGGGFDEDEDEKGEYRGSSDYYLRELSVDGYSFTNDFHKTRDTYFVDVEAGVSSIDVKAVPCDGKAKVYVTGSERVAEDLSKVLVRVKAENGQVKVYRIYVRHSAGKGSK